MIPGHLRIEGVFENIHSGERFWSDAFSVTVFNGYVLTVGQTGEKISFFKQKRILVDGASVVVIRAYALNK